MGKKVKIGKQRRDKAYWSAKEIGFRSRASFKLVQLNRKFEFLQKARVCIDLCAAPGSWMQVAKENMPMSSLIIGVDLAPIKPIPGCITMVNDITTDKCRAEIKKELQGWKADIVLHDGAPNVGKSWIHDAYQQSLLTLSSFKLATEFLMKNGTYVTKVFRSKDYQSLLWVFNQFFKKVHSTKPAASRNESAEIFVVCLGYKAPDKIDPRFLDPKYVFSEIEADPDQADKEILNPEKKKKAPAEGYELGATTLFKAAKASEFIMENKPIHVLNNFSEIVLDEQRIANHPKTTQEIRECCKDLKVLGMKELKTLKKWREALRKDFDKTEKDALEQRRIAEQGDQEPEDVNPDDEAEAEEENELQELEDQITNLKEEERKNAKRLKKKKLKEKRKIAERIDLKMILPGDEGPKMEEEGLFRIKDLQSRQDLEKVGEQAPDVVAESDSDDDEPKKKKKKIEKIAREKGKLDRDGLFYKETDSDTASSDEYETEEELDGIGLEAMKGKKVKKMTQKDLDDFNNPSSNPLITDLDHSSVDDKKQRRADLWFSRDIFKGIAEDEELLEEDIKAGIQDLAQKGKKVISKTAQSGTNKNKNDNDSSSSDDDEDDEESGYDEGSDESDFDVEESYKNTKKQAMKEKEGFEVVPVNGDAPPGKKKKKVVLNPEELALGQEMIKSKKRKRELMDAGWNRYMFNDRDCDLPDWFVKEERIHARPILDVDPKVVGEYTDRQKDLNVRTIKKVVEAKARKKRKMYKKLEKAKKKASILMENPDLGNKEKANEIKKMYKKAQSSQKKEVTYVVAKKATASKRAKRPAGMKGLYKQVDPRMKKDNQKKRGNATNKKIQKRRLKGKQANPNAKK